MGQKEDSKKRKKGQHLSQKDRIKIEVLNNRNYSTFEIALEIGCSQRTVQRELKRGRVTHLSSELINYTTYSSDRGQMEHDLNATAKGPQLKLGCNWDMVRFISDQIITHKASPDVIAAKMRQQKMPGAVSTKTIYNYIDAGLIEGVTNESLLEKRKRKKRGRRKVRVNKKMKKPRTSIEKRPPEVELRMIFGDWEGDLVVGPLSGSGEVLLVLTERKSRYCIIRKLPDKTQESVLKAIDRIEREFGAVNFREIFLSITFDNGSEFLDMEKLEKSAFSRKKRMKVYYAHPYASWERGSNENTNRMIRRFIAKGRDIKNFTHKEIEQVQQWMNTYLRKILNYASAQELYLKEAA